MIGTTTFRFAAQAIECTAEPSHLAWLAEFLCPWFEPAPATEPGARVKLVVDDRRYEEVLRNGAAGGPRIPAFGLDRGMLELSLWRETPRERIVVDEDMAAVYRLRDAGTEVTVFGRRANPKLRPAFMRVVREFAMSEARGRGGLLLHAAALTIAGHGVVVAGPKRSGKTTVLLQALRGEGAEFVSNDRVILRSDASPVARGMPTIVRISPETLELLPDLREPLESGRYDHRFTRSEAASGRVQLRPRAGRPRSPAPAQLCELLGVPARREVAIRAVVLLRLGAGFRLRELSAGSAAEQLASARFGSAERGSALFRFPPACGSEPSALSLRALAAQTPCYECERGDDADEAQVRRSLRQLVERPRHHSSR